MIRVLHIVNNMNQGGLETFIMNIYRNIDRDKIQFDFLVHTTEKAVFDEEISSLGGKIFRVPSRREGIIKNRNALKQFFREHSEYKIVHQHVNSLSYITPLKIAKKMGVRTRVVHSHSSKLSGNKIGDINGKEVPIVRSIQGRKLDFIYSSDGAKIPPANIANGFKNIPNGLIRSQVTQNRIGEVTILLETDSKKYKSDYDQMIKNEFYPKLGRDTMINIRHVDEIPREKSGKFRMIKNNVSQV